jgi:hypothetical protein
MPAQAGIFVMGRELNRFAHSLVIPAQLDQARQRPNLTVPTRAVGDLMRVVHRF